MEYIKFSKTVNIKLILEILSELKIEYTYLSDFSISLEGFANGLSKIDKTLCFIETIKDTAQITSMSEALILTNIKPDEKYKDYNLLYLKDARYVFIKLLEYFSKNSFLENFTTNIDSKVSYISKAATVHETAILEENVIVEDDAIVSAGCVIKNGTYIGKGSIIRENCTIGCNGIALYKAKNGEVLRFPHIAGVYIGNNVEIGANCVFVKGTLSNTKINDDTVIGNLCNIGHGVKIGKKVWISVGGMIGGNCTIEDYVTIGLSASLKDNLFIASESTIGMGSVVTKSLKDKATVFGNPAKPLRPLNVGPKR